MTIGAFDSTEPVDTYAATFPGARADRQMVRDRELLYAMRRAFEVAANHGLSMKCREGRHAPWIGTPTGCANDGSTCLCECHDPR